MKTAEISDIDEMLRMLPEQAVHEIRDFAAYLVDRKKRRKALVERVLKAEQNPDTVTCSSAEEFLQAIESAEEDDDSAGAPALLRRQSESLCGC